MSQNADEIRCINTIRTLSIDAIQKANSGHPGAPMGMAPVAHVLFSHHLKHNPKNPNWPDRDRVVLSAGHASMLLYSLLHLTGYDLSIDDIKNFRQWGSRTPGHPEYGHTPGVETTTGPLGQGFANAVGMAMAERFVASRFNRPGHPVCDHYTYVITGDGCMQEGVSSEAASLAGHLGLSRLIVIYDDNDITIEGHTDIAFTEDVGKRFAAYNWQVLEIAEGRELEDLGKAIVEAREDKDRPTLIIVHTQIACGSPNLQGKADAHGAPLGEDEVRATKDACDWPLDPTFHVPDDVYACYKKVADKGAEAEKDWEVRLEKYSKAHPELAEEFRRTMAGELPDGWDADIPTFSCDDGPVATRSASGAVLNAIAKRVPSLIGGSADLAPSNKTGLAGEGDFARLNYQNRVVRFGVREHAMGAIMSGMYLHGGARPFGGTFLVFADYMKPAIRMAALMGLPAIYIFTHDSVAVGEDGPTHQPIEHLLSLRCIPNTLVLRPMDANETAEAWRVAMQSRDRPVAMMFSRQKLPVVDRARYGGAAGLEHGAYILHESDPDKTPDIILIGTGAEVHVALAAAEKLCEQNLAVRVVSMPSWELFEEAGKEYRDKVLPPEVTQRVAVEAGRTMGWERYVGAEGVAVGIDRFGASAPGGEVLDKLGINPQNVFDKAMEVLRK
ncbi:MAG: transketolase [Desulfatibacillaceae bacterium]